MSINEALDSDIDREPTESEVEQMQLIREDSELVPKEGLTTLRLMILVYFWTASGPFGIEPAVGASGAALTLVGLVVISLLWSLPQAFMAAELSLMMNTNGGNIIWVQYAFGDFLGFFNAGCFLGGCIVSQALATSLFVQYIVSMTPLSDPIQWVLRLSFIITAVLVNLKGVEYLSKLSWVLLVIIFSPFVAVPIMSVVLHRSVKFAPLLDVPPLGSIHWGLYLSTLIWCLGGFDYVGGVAGKIRGGKKSFILGVLGAFPLNIINYSYPIIVTFVLDGNYQNWNAGYFTYIVNKFFPMWLSIWILISSILSNFGSVTSNMSQLSWTMWAMGKGRKDQVAQHRYLPYFVSWSWPKEGASSRPIVAILLIGVLNLLVATLPYNFITQLYLLVRIANIVCEYASLIWLRFKEPNKIRPFRVPGGRFGPFLWSLPTFVIIVITLFTTDTEVLIAGGVSICVIAACYPLKLLWIFCTHKVYHVLSKTIS